MKLSTNFTVKTLLNFKRVIFKNCLLLGLLVLPKLSFSYITITTDVVWDSPADFISGYADGIRINSGSLTLNSVTLEMNENSIIQVNNGTYLKLENANIISSDQSNDKTWGGIRYSHAFSDHFNQYENDADFPDPQYLNDEGKWEGDIDLPNQTNPVVMIYFSTISDAEIGVYAEDGMIVIARNSNFTNNAKSVFFDNYEDPYRSGWQRQFNASYLMDCEFTWTKKISSYNWVTDLVHIELNKVRGVRIGGCKFYNNISDQDYFCPDQRGYGIRSINSTFALSLSGNCLVNDNSSYSCTNNGYTSPNPYQAAPQRNTFNKLYKGIYIQDDSKYDFAVRGIVLRNSDFSNNFVGVDVVGMDFFKILDCEFVGNRAEIEDLMADAPATCFTNTTLINDINIDMGTEYEIYDNRFTYTGDYISHINITGMSWNWITSKIQKNTFSNTDPNTIASNKVVGVNINNSNLQLEFKCNEFSNMGTDINVGAANSIKLSQGSTALGAGNKFSTQLAGRFRLNNNSGIVIDYYLANLSSTYDPLTSGYTQSSMGLNRISNPPTSEPEGSGCEILCSEFRSSIKNEYVIKKKIEIYPQPASQELNLTFLYPGINFNKFIIFDNLGREVLSGIIDGQDFIKIDTKNFLSGVYLILFSDKNNNSISEKFLIQN